MKRITDFLEKHFNETQRQWIWFVLLWCFGLGCVLTLGSAIKLLMGV
jgi:hypothetical protein